MPQFLIMSVITGILFLISWGAIVYLIIQTRKLKSQLLLLQQISMANEVKLKQVDDEFHEIHTGSQALGRKVKELVVSIKGLREQHQQLAEQDPQSRFYLNAVKLITDGASLEEVMRECDLPRAEAELLFNLHQS
ncbi:MAG: DUF2802 domain-containing protein [Paraglaciecola sp.]|uniref:DUF2802 domain-containing protein n=1 Tax=Paraglaciecola sp. TaxID=1920173 RepID=UPI00274013AD|nr:DUF2802 domain-containing protein [Paraglaciecola sp.]MDP5032717.1 DUF2802 domain-containing protein [Paraglaciecola sp.]MDP5040572.1 DUF2802 domain-containing protein [Paraglaciecola sp.]MDP5132198.1 DUF2802 domain-containing protein [Paraglaciecola sp.]